MKAFYELITLRSQVDDRCAKDLENGLKKVQTNAVYGTTSATFMDCREATSQLAKQHQQLSASFRDMAIESDKMIKELKNTKTRLQDNHIRLLKDRESRKNAHLKAKAVYEESVRKAENATISLSAARTQCQQDKAIRKLEIAVADAIKDLDKNHKAYIRSVSECQQTQGKYEHEVSSMLSQFEELENRRLIFFQEQLGRFVAAQELVREFSEHQYQFLNRSHLSIDTVRDVLYFIVDKYTGRIPDLHVEYRPKTSDLIPHYADPAALEESNNHMMAQKLIHEHLLRNAGASTLEALRQTYATNSAAEAGGIATSPTTTTSGFNKPTSSPSFQSSSLPASTYAPSSSKTARALYDFHGQEPGDLDFRMHDTITLTLCDPGEEWWQGSISGRSGTFPRDYVEIINESAEAPAAATPAPAPSATPEAAASPSSATSGGLPPGVLKKVVAQYDFNGEASDELSFRVGDTLFVIGEIDGWFEGSNEKGDHGIFPANYVVDA